MSERKRKYPPEVIERAITLREEQGLAITQIAAQVNMTAAAVEYHCLRLGAEPPNAPLLDARRPLPDRYTRNGHVVRRFTADDDATLLEMEAAGAGTAQIARRLGRTPSSITGRLRTLARHEARKEMANA